MVKFIDICTWYVFYAVTQGSMFFFLLLFICFVFHGKWKSGGESVADT